MSIEVDPVLEAAFAGVGTAKIPGAGRTPRLPLGTHTVMLKQFRVRPTRKGQRMCEADVLVLDSNVDGLAGQTRNSAWFPGQDGFGIQDGFLREFLESGATGMGDTSPAPRFLALLAHPGQPGRGLKLLAIVTEQRDKFGNTKPDPKNPGQNYTETHWRSIPQAIDDIVAARGVLDADPAHALRAEQPQQVQQTIAPPPVQQPVVQAAPAVAAAPAATPGASAGLLASLMGKKQ